MFTANEKSIVKQKKRAINVLTFGLAPNLLQPINATQRKTVFVNGDRQIIHCLAIHVNECEWNGNAPKYNQEDCFALKSSREFRSNKQNAVGQAPAMKRVIAKTNQNNEKRTNGKKLY